MGQEPHITLDEMMQRFPMEMTGTTKIVGNGLCKNNCSFEARTAAAAHACVHLPQRWRLEN